MRIATLQFSPSLGQVSHNIDRANALLEASPPQNLDLLVLPELTFTGYNFPSLPAILPHLEPSAAGPSTLWARTTAAKYNCIVSVGYPELYTPESTSSTSTSTSTTSQPPRPTAYNSTITVSPTGQTLAHYRKTHLYYTDTTWALPSPSPTPFLTTTLPLPLSPSSSSPHTTRTAFGICMDLNPHQFLSPPHLYEFATAALTTRAQLVVLSMAWLTLLPAAALAAAPEDPDWDTFAYWIGRLGPLVGGRGEVVVVVANRGGEEEGGARYAGSSWVGKVGGGRVRVGGIMGRVEEGVGVVDLEDGEGEERVWVVKEREGEGDGDGDEEVE